MTDMTTQVDLILPGAILADHSRDFDVYFRGDFPLVCESRHLMDFAGLDCDPFDGLHSVCPSLRCA